VEQDVFFKKTTENRGARRFFKKNSGNNWMGMMKVCAPLTNGALMTTFLVERDSDNVQKTVGDW
jgi:hypothetical protein